MVCPHLSLAVPQADRWMDMPKLKRLVGIFQTSSPTPYNWWRARVSHVHTLFTPEDRLSFAFRPLATLLNLLGDAEELDILIVNAGMVEPWLYDRDDDDEQLSEHEVHALYRTALKDPILCAMSPSNSDSGEVTDAVAKVRQSKEDRLDLTLDRVKFLPMRQYLETKDWRGEFEHHEVEP